MSEEKNGEQVKLATEAQIKLILQLYTETDYVRKYTEAELRKLSCEELSVHIAKVKDWKLARSQQAIETARVSGFDKISFAMLYKCMLNDSDRQYFAHRCAFVGLNEALHEQYVQYREAADYCKQKVQEGGQN